MKRRRGQGHSPPRHSQAVSPAASPAAAGMRRQLVERLAVQRRHGPVCGGGGPGPSEGSYCRAWVVRGLHPQADVAWPWRSPACRLMPGMSAASWVLACAKICTVMGLGVAAGQRPRWAAAPRVAGAALLLAPSCQLHWHPHAMFHGFRRPNREARRTCIGSVARRWQGALRLTWRAADAFQ